MDNRSILLFLSIAGLNNRELTTVVENYIDLNEIFDSRFMEGKLNEKTAETILHKIDRALLRTDIDHIEEMLSKNSIQFTTVYDDNYPVRLRDIDDNPKLLYIKGCLHDELFSISVVGSRKCTEYGAWVVKKLVSELADLKVSIVSGLALGVDGLAHRAALKAGAYTIGVLGNGVDIVYPKSNSGLYREILEAGGAIVSELPPGAPPLPYQFPMRNRIISGLSQGLLVIEAKEKSGTLITAGLAASQGREVFAVPGNINSIYSKGTNQLIKDGAKSVTCIEDIVEELSELERLVANAKRIQRDLTMLGEDELKIYRILIEDQKTIDDLADITGLSVGSISAALTLMEMENIAESLDNKWFISDR